MPDKLPPDPDALEKWKNLPQNKPSKEALPPVAGGTRWLWGMLALSILVLIVLLLQRGAG